MYRTTLCLGTSSQFELSTAEQLQLFCKTGFEAFFTGWDDRLGDYRERADALGLMYQSVHAPFSNAAHMWETGAAAEDAVKELLQCVKDCAAVKVPILVVHPYIGFEEQPKDMAEGVEHFRRVVEEAAAHDVKIAFENVEGEDCLATLMQAFRTYETVGFCWDSGHELCYNRGKDMLALYGDRLIATHLNDNLGVSDAGGTIFWTDDLHLLPFDGIHRWEQVAQRLNRCGYDGILTFELNKISKPNRHENDKYTRMSIEEYIAECYVRACRVAYLKNG